MRMALTALGVWFDGVRLCGEMQNHGKPEAGNLREKGSSPRGAPKRRTRAVPGDVFRIDLQREPRSDALPARRRRAVPAGQRYRMGWGDLAIGYRHLEWDLDRFGPLDQLNLGGPFLGAKFSF